MFVINCYLYLTCFYFLERFFAFLVSLFALYNVTLYFKSHNNDCV